MGADSESASKNMSGSTVLIPIYSNLKNLTFLLASDLVKALRDLGDAQKAPGYSILALVVIKTSGQVFY